MRVLTGVLVILVAGFSATAEGPRKPRKAKPMAKTKPAGRMLSKAQETEAFTFAHLHHPELAELLVGLKRSNARAYRRALNELHATSIRINRYKERVPKRYESALEMWKVDSRIRLLTAKLSVKDDATMNSQLQALLKKKTALRLKELTAEQKRLEERLKRVKSQVESIKADPDAAAQKDFQKIKRTIGAYRTGSKKKPNPRTKTVKVKSP